MWQNTQYRNPDLEEVCELDTESSSFPFNFNLDFLIQTQLNVKHLSRMWNYTPTQMISNMEYEHPICVLHELYSS